MKNIYQLIVPLVLGVLLTGCGTSTLGNPAENSSAPTATTVTLSNPDAPLNGYQIVSAAERQNQSGAGMPEYVFLINGMHALAWTGSELASSVTIDTQAIWASQNVSFGYIRPSVYSAQGYSVTVNESLAYRIVGNDYEYEIEVAQLILTYDGNKILPHSRAGTSFRWKKRTR